MLGQESYAVVTSPEAWLRLEMIPGELVECVRSELGHLAEELARLTERRAATRTLYTGGGYAALVSIDHEARIVTLCEVGHVGHGGASDF